MPAPPPSSPDSSHELLDLTKLRSLVVLAECGSITETANRLHLTPAAIYKQLKSLESLMELPLYTNTGHRLCLTHSAKVLLPHIKTLLSQHDAVYTTLNELRGVERGLVRIGTGPTFSIYVLPQILQEFRKAFPKVDIYVETGHTPVLIEHLRHGKLDLAFLITSPLSELPGLCVELTHDFEIVLVSNSSERIRKCSMQDLESHSFILYQEESIFEQRIVHYFNETGLQPKVTMRFDNAESIKAMVRSGLGLSMLPAWTVTRELQEQSLTLIRQSEPPLHSQIDVITPKVSYRPKAVDAFLELVREWSWKDKFSLDV